MTADYFLKKNGQKMLASAGQREFVRANGAIWSRRVGSLKLLALPSISATRDEWATRVPSTAAKTKPLEAPPDRNVAAYSLATSQRSQFIFLKSRSMSDRARKQVN